MTVVAINIPLLSGMAEDVHLAPTTDAATGGDATEISWRIGVALRWWARPLRPILADKNAKALERALDNLNQRLTGAAAKSA